MSIVIIFNHKDPTPWKSILQERIPDVPIEVYPNVVDFERVTFALCWKPATNVLSQFPNVRVVQSVGASAEHIIQTQKLDSSVILTRIVDPQLSLDMYEFVLTAALTHLKNIPTYATETRNQIWQQHPYRNISNTTVCVLGLGEIGGFVAEKLSQIGFMVKGWSNSKKEIENVESFYGINGLPNALASTDILVNLLPLTPSTENILNLTNLQRLKKGAYLINVGRGQHLIDHDLLELLDRSHLSGALLDVFREEPLPVDHPFWRTDTISITPHIAALTNVTTAAEIVVTNFRAFQNNQKLSHIVSMDQGY